MALTTELVGNGLFISAARAIQGTLQSGITADPGSSQAAAFQLTRAINVVATVATIGDSLRLPKAEVGDEIWVRNNAANSLDIFPQVGGTINNGSVDAAYAVAGTKTAVLKATTTLDWIAAVTA